MSQRRLMTLALAVGIGAVAGCASIPAPREEISAAELALRRADQARAAEFAPLEVQIAREQLDAAREAMRSQNHEGAQRAAEKSLVDSELALAKAQSARSRAIADSINEDIEALRAESARASERLR